MANLLEIAELAYNQIFPLPRDKNAIALEEFIATAKIEYAAAMWIYRQEQISNDGSFEMPSDLLTESEPLDVVNNEIDISSLNYLSSLPNDLWLQNIGGLGCECTYIKTTIRLSQILCEDDSIPESSKPYLIVGKKIKFPKGTHAKSVAIIYANNGTGIDPRVIECNEYVGSKVREKLMGLYGKKLPADTTNNQNVDQ